MRLWWVIRLFFQCSYWDSSYNIMKTWPNRASKSSPDEKYKIVEYNLKRSDIASDVSVRSFSCPKLAWQIIHYFLRYTASGRPDGKNVFTCSAWIFAFPLLSRGTVNGLPEARTPRLAGGRVEFYRHSTGSNADMFCFVFFLCFCVFSGRSASNDNIAAGSVRVDNTQNTITKRANE